MSVFQVTAACGTCGGRVAAEALSTATLSQHLDAALAAHVCPPAPARGLAPEVRAMAAWAALVAEGFDASLHVTGAASGEPAFEVHVGSVPRGGPVHSAAHRVAAAQGGMVASYDPDDELFIFWPREA